MDRASLYDDAYRPQKSISLVKLQEDVERDSKRMLLWAQEGRDKFLQGREWQGLRILECGGGTGGVSLQLAELGARCTLVDVSATALELAQSLAQAKGVALTTHALDVGTPPEVELGQFDMIIDSHLLHCLPLAPERASFFQLVKDHLAPGGIVVGETMAFRKKIFIPDGWRFDEEKVLWQKFADWVPVRRVADSLDIEAEFTSAGFKIVCFLYYANYGIAPSSAYWDIPADVMPAAVRYVLVKA